MRIREQEVLIPTSMVGNLPEPRGGGMPRGRAIFVATGSRRTR